MSEKMHSISMASGNLSTPMSAGGAMPSTPTLITFVGAKSSLSPTIAACGDDVVPLSSSVHGSNSNVVESAIEFPTASGTISAHMNFQLMPIEIGGGGGGGGMGDLNSIMNTSQISTNSIESGSLQLTTSLTGGVGNTGLAKQTPNNGRHLAAQSVAGKSCRFPKLEECAHFHYERVQLGPLSVQLVDDKSEQMTSSIASQSIGGDIAQAQNTALSTGTGPGSLRSFSPSSCWFIIKVFPHRYEPFLVKRSFENMQMFDEMLHRCVYDRKISGLRDLEQLEFKSEEDVEYAVAKYLDRFSKIASDSLTCGTILTWLQLDNKGRRLPLADSDTQRTINTPAVGAAYGVRRYQAQAPDEISIEVGDMISVIDMPSPAESVWWRGKKSHLQKSHYEVGFFPQSCVATIGDKVPRNFPMPAPLVGQLDVSPTKPVLRKHGKLIAFFRSFILSRPSRRRLKQSGIYRERVFSCDLSEHLLNSGQEIPMVLKSCAEFIENYGIIDGIYRLSGITSNIQRLRRAFDEERVPDLGNPEMKQDIHAVSSLLKMYFRELPNPLCTYQLYDNFVEAIQVKSESLDRLRLMKETVLKLPPPHYRTLKYLSEHLYKISQHHERTGMTDKNLAIVWAPNLLRSPALESGGVAALRGVGVQAVVTEYLIRNCNNIFDALDDSNVRFSYIGSSGAMPAPTELRMDSLTDCESLLIEQREHDQAITFVERPKSLSAGGAKLISLEEAQERHSKVEGLDVKQTMPMNMVASNTVNIGSYIEVGGGPSSLPDKYHTVLSVPRSWHKRKTHSWKSLFSRNQRPISSDGTHELKSGGPNIPNEEGSCRTHHKEATQVTFAEADSIIKTGKIGKSLTEQDKPKSIELFETTREPINKTIDICVRSNSIDSLRTAGHSRSVSHDSYFDLLQSPQRSHMTTCPSRELSELGINFDREEPEMRLFSESESLVSSPRVGKENIPPSSALTSRRIMRARPEEFSSQTNSVNPSPKKQPRLNLLLSPSTAAGPSQNWPHLALEHTEICEEHKHHSSDESCCKRYKLEDQLSDIQFIDCGTPEHANVNPQTMVYASVQVHAPPKPAHTKNASNKNAEWHVHETTKASPTTACSRYSYPSVQLGSKRKELDGIHNATKERYSYPGSGARDMLKSNTEQEHDLMTTSQPRMVCFSGPLHSSSAKSLSLAAKPNYELLRAKNRSSYCSSNSVDMPKEHSNNDTPIMERSKLSVTPSSPVQSPRYSLLVAETSSENSSTVVTPQYDLNPLMITSGMSGLSGGSIASSSNAQRNLLLSVDGKRHFDTSHESIGSNFNTNSHNAAEKRDMLALKRELSLDLAPMNTKAHIDQADGNNRAATLPSKQQQHLHHMIPSPNNSNFTDNTSQSVTPSEFGYQNLQRQLSMHSLIETDENSPTYDDDYENTPSNTVSPTSGAAGSKGASPIKSTISITYNLKSPNKEFPTKEIGQQKPLLETSFDEHTVYEQVKMFRNSVTEVNQLLNDNNKNVSVLVDLEEVNEKQINDEDVSLTRANEMSNELFQLSNRGENLNQYRKSEIEDLYEAREPVDSDEERLLYENVELRKPKSVYENMLGKEMRVSLIEADRDSKRSNDKIEQDSLESIKTPDTDSAPEQSLTIHRKSPSNFSVKELATKFESSPVEQLPAFDFSTRSSTRKSHIGIETQQNEATLTVPAAAPIEIAANLKQKLNKSQQITRSLDENAFVREFGGKQLQEATARSTQQLADINNRRKSFDFTRPKTLNPPKRLPGIPITEENCLNDFAHYTKTDKTECDMKLLQITPTTENRISLIQNNVLLPAANIAVSSAAASASADLNNHNMNNIKGVLSGVKLDRERINKIKEERRQQLSQKYYNEPLKSRSKTDLDSASKDDDKKFHADSMRVKSKSRGDMNALQKDIDNAKQFGRAAVSSLHAGSESTLNMGPGYNSHRMRSISDEKNQNCDTTGTHNNVKAMAMATTTTTTNSFHKEVANMPQDYEEFSARATVQKFEKKTMDFSNGGSAISVRERSRDAGGYTGVTLLAANRNATTATREKISPQFSIRDMTAMFESRSQNQQ